MPNPWHVESPTLLVRKVCVGPLENNVYVVACARTREAVIVDAADEYDRIRREVTDVTVSAVLTTHGHWDHVQAAFDVSRALDVPLRIHAYDAELAGMEPDLAFTGDEDLAVGEITIGAWHTPGHTAGSMCFVTDGHLFSGDTLFPGGPGATRGPGADFGQIMHSLESRLFTLPDDTLVHPGHGLDTTIGTERPALAEWRARGW